MKYFSNVFLVLLLLTLQTSCSRNTPGNRGSASVVVQTLNGRGYRILGESQLNSTATQLTGTGSILFKDPLPMTEGEDFNFSLDFSLDAGGSVTLVSHSDDALNNGVNVRLARGETGQLEVRLQILEETYDLTPDFEGLALTEPMRISIDVHKHGEVLFWTGPFEGLEFAFVTKPKGKLWGLHLDRATLREVNLGPAKHQH